MTSSDHSTVAASAPSTAPLSALRRLAPYVRPHRTVLLVAAAAALGSTLAGLGIPLLIGAVVDGPLARGDAAGLLWLALAVLGLGVIEAAMTFLRRLLVARPSNAVETAMRADLFAHLQRLPMAFHDRWPSGQLLSRMTQDMTIVRWFIAFIGLYTVVNAVTAIVAIAVLVWLAPLIGLLVAALSTPMVLGTLYLERRLNRLYRRSQDQSGDLATIVEESVLGIRVLKSLGRGRSLALRFLSDARGLRATNVSLARTLGLLFLLVVVSPELTLAVVVGVGAVGVAGGDLTLGTLVAVVTVFGYMMWPIQSLGWLLSETSNTAAALARFGEVRGLVPAVAAPRSPVPLPRPVRGEVRLRDVTFAHDGSDRPVLQGLDLTVRAGETLALVGATGSGKTALVELLPRLFDVTGGAVEIDGVDVRALDPAELRRTVATAFEDPVLISASVRENVALGHPDAGDDEVWEALRTARADGFVDALPHGLDTRIGEQGLSLSGGQRQRLALARAILGAPSVLVLDDPLSALDVHTEAEVEAALRRVLGSTTAIVVAHRVSTVRLADRVAMLADGRITAVGTHRELLATDPAYRTLLTAGQEVPV